MLSWITVLMFGVVHFHTGYGGPVALSNSSSPGAPGIMALPFVFDKIRLLDIKALTFYEGLTTTGRRNPSRPQLRCVGGRAGCANYLPHVVQCYNKGNDGVKVQWKCESTLDDRVDLGAVIVICEGYDSSLDPYVLVGSCGLDYQLNWRGSEASAVNVALGIVICIVAAIVVVTFWFSCRGNRSSRTYSCGETYYYGGNTTTYSYSGGGSGSHTSSGYGTTACT